MSGADATERTRSSAGVEIATLDLLDHQAVEWERVQRTAFLIHQHFTYHYPGPIEDLRHRLVVVPPETHLDQRRVVYRLDVSAPDAVVSTQADEFGNTVLEIAVPRVEDAIEFEAWIVAERRRDASRAIDSAALHDARYLQPTRRTAPDATLLAVAADLRAAGGSAEELAGRIGSWTAGHLRYAHDTTDIHTTAADALHGGTGVCQDYAHIALALCRACGLPARYVSGHLLGEGGTHAWVEVLLPDGGGGAVAWPFDPTHDREPGMSYVTVATGRDYGDVAPTSGTYRASYPGQLSARKSVGLTGVEYAEALR